MLHPLPRCPPLAPALTPGPTQAEEFHQQYLAKGGRFGQGQSTAKGCDDPIRCYG